MSRRGSHLQGPRASSSRGFGFYLRVIALLVALVVVLAAIFVGVQLNRGVPKASASVVLHGKLTAAGSRPSLPVPSQGTTDVAVEGLGTLATHDPGKEVPLASITKLVTALVVLAHHPLGIGEQGPQITVPASIASAYPAEAAAHDSVIKLTAGEHLSELQCLEAMLVPSADNVADLLAIWTAGSQSAFVSEMNAEAAALGLHHTHFADPAGLSYASVGSAADMVRLGRVVMSKPLLEQIVAMPQVDLPLAGLVYNYDYDLGRDGIVGIKTGSTVDGGGDFLWAARRKLHGREVTVIGAVLAQFGKNELQTALDAAKSLSVAAFSDLHQVSLLQPGRTVVRISTPWGSSTRAVTTRGVSALGYSGEQVTAVARLDGAAGGGRLAAPLRSGEQVASVEVELPSGAVTVPATTVGPVVRPSISWRLERNL